MGLENRTPGNYITILNGKFCQRVPENTIGAVARVLEKGVNAGKTVYEKYYTSFTGKLVGIKTQDSTAYGKNWIFSFRDGGAVYNLTLSYSNSFSNAFLKMLPNIDVTREMKLSPSIKEVDGKNKSSLFVNQDNIAIKHAYTRENPNGLPQMVQTQFKGQMVWDDTDQLNFLEEMVMTQIVPKLEGVTVAESASPEDAPEEKSSSLDDLATGMKAVDAGAEEDGF